MDSTLAPIWGSLIVFIVCPLIGGLPLIDWMTYALTGRHLAKLGTGNVSVSAAFYHGGKVAGILAVISEAAKGIVVVMLTRMFFPTGSVWELLALIALVMGRYWLGKGAGTTNVTWGILAHDLRIFGVTFLLGGISFTINRDRQWGKVGVLIILSIVIGLFHPSEPEYWLSAIALSSLLWWIYQKIPDDLDLSPNKVHQQSSKVFRFFQADKNILSLDNKLKSNKVGAKAANLAFVKSLGYAVPEGWVLSPAEESQALVDYLQPSSEQPLIVRSSAIGEDSINASAAGQYLSILNVVSKEALKTAILDCQASYLQKSAQKYRAKNQQTGAMAVLVQQQIRGLYSGVAFSRDPVNSLNSGVAIEALPGNATQVVSGKVTPQRYQVILPELPSSGEPDRTTITQIAIVPQPETISNNIPRDILESVALLAREMEEIFRGTPQDIEWTYDGEQLWLLQVRPITTLKPIWTRKIAAEVIPGQIHPLTWSINQPLTCGVWGKLFAIVLGKKVRDLDFNQTATLHYARAYFNASLLGDIFLRMGLPPESLEFLTRGEKFTKPPLLSTIKNIPGLWRLCQRELSLEQDFTKDNQELFEPLLNTLQENPPQTLTEETEILSRIDRIIEALEKATYYSILAPLSFAFRQGLFKVSLDKLDNSQTPEISSMQALAIIAADTRKLISKEQITMNSCASLFAYLAENPEGESILHRFNNWLAQYGYLGDVATDIAIPRWLDNPRSAREVFSRFFFDAVACEQAKTIKIKSSFSSRETIVQTRLNLKGKVSEVYSKFLAHLRWSFVALESCWLQNNFLTEPGDIFHLKLSEIKDLVNQINQLNLAKTLNSRKKQWQQTAKLTLIPYLVYGNPDSSVLTFDSATLKTSNILTGIGTSQGQIEGTIKVISNLQQNTSDINKQTILVVPYTDAGWSPLLAVAGGLISEVGGSLSHGAIIAREYGIPAVMDIPYATQLLHDGKKARINGQTGIVEILD